MQLELAQAIVDEARNHGDDDSARVIEDYSGKGMYGKTTAAVSVAANEDYPHDFRRDMGPKMAALLGDSMGHDIIVY